MEKKVKRIKGTKTVDDRPLFEVRYALKEVREGVGMSQAQLSHASGIPRTAIANVETGRYAMAASWGIRLFVALFRAAPLDSPYRKQAVASVSDLADQQFELDRKQLLADDGQIEFLKGRRKEIQSREADIKAKLTWLKSQES